MEDAAGRNVDLYIPRKCSWTKRLIHAKDHASVQINVGEVDDSGIYTGRFSTFALCGYIRHKGEADEALLTLVEESDAGRA
eukprot:CAMPEP_0185578406 /NCGR_PEP_ID=MMETSP0434-20130131/12863_1 /TAXON_ID=626734 ORGANISM="Favella taraikaensis, Strain Fe Narragansett Bay" /NCGR_SAMPLE_ID=MMETSP0434 /ASSEMBLY_ACC=CAM_ASM_000379 /LENGTH=80 /DNA_ID=CAMNT_0028196203 /DNA_START=34 /DNA_END=276 /DNA_ORIENTATION=+